MVRVRSPEPRTWNCIFAIMDPGLQGTVVCAPSADVRAQFCSIVFVALGSPLATAAQSSAHHSVAAEYDSNRKLTVTGTVTRLEWTNPHARLYVDAMDEKGAVVHWDFELGPPTSLMRRGWNRKSLLPGHVVTV